MKMNGKELSDARHALGWSQDQAAAFVGYNRASWARMENNTQGIKRSVALAMLYHAPLNDERERLLAQYLRGYEFEAVEITTKRKVYY